MSDMEDVDRGIEAMQLEGGAPECPVARPEFDSPDGPQDGFVAAEFSEAEFPEEVAPASEETGEFALALPDAETDLELAEVLEAGPARPPAPRRSRRRECVEASTPPMRRILEAILFATDKPVTAGQLLEALPGREVDEIEAELRSLAEEYVDERRGFRLIPCAGGYQVRSDPEMHEYVTRFLVGKRRTRLSRAALETLAIIAYRQPITRGECEDVRGVDSGQVIHTLLERNLVTIRGRSQALGRPLLYGTTGEFLRYFGINTLADLPSPEELQALLGVDPLDDPDIRRALDDEGFGDASAAAPVDATESSSVPPTVEGSLAAEPARTEDEAADGGPAGDADWAEASRAPLGGA